MKPVPSVAMTGLVIGGTIVVMTTGMDSIELGGSNI
jgi:hypothetical protein